jgi:hypothetical protein
MTLVLNFIERDIPNYNRFPPPIFFSGHQVRTADFNSLGITIMAKINQIYCQSA